MFSSLPRAVLSVLAAVGIPVGCVASIPALRDNPLITVALIFAYEFGVLLAGVGSAVLAQLHSRWSVRIADAFDGAVQRQFSGYTRFYLRYVAADTRYIDLKGVASRAEFTLEMKDIYVRLALDADPAWKSSANPVDYAPWRTGNGAEVWEWLRDGQGTGSVIVILGPPGRGKTTLLRHIAFVIASGGRTASRLKAPQKIPVIVYLRDHKDWTFSTPADLVDLIMRALPSIGGRPRPPQWIEKNLRRGRFLLLIDGLDEIPDAATRRAMTSWIETQASAQAGNLLLITSRPFGYRDNEIIGATVVNVQAFTAGQIDAFITQWYRATSIRSYGGDNESARIAAARGAAELSTRLGQTRALHDLASNPLLLTMIATVHHYRDALPGSRAELYREICDVFLGKRHEARGVVLDMPAARKKMVLQELAFAMMLRGVRDLSVADAAELVEPALTRVATRISPADFLRRVEESSGLLLERERGLLMFAHLTLQEFLAAEHIRENKLGRELIGFVEHDWWRETTLLYAANADATEIISACLRAEGEREAELLALAVQCVEEARELSPETRSLVEQRLNPPGLRANPASRRNAARARLLLRATREQRVSRDSYIGPPVTWLEYQHFLDSIDDCRVPDHWAAPVFPEGAQNEAATGMRHDDALAFCTWLTTELGAEHKYRLPSTRELDVILGNNESSTIYWSANAFGAHSDRRVSRLFRAYNEQRERVPYPSADYERWRGEFLRIANEDLVRVDELADGLTLSIDVPGSGSFAVTLIGDELLPSEIDSTTPLPTNCDLRQVTRKVAEVARIADAYADLVYPGDLNADISGELARMGAGLVEVAGQAFDRESRRARQDFNARQARQAARIMVVAMANVAAALRNRWVGNKFTDPTRVLRRLEPNREEDRQLIGIMAISLLHDYLRALYLQLLLHEARVTGAIPPLESFRYVRVGQHEGGVTSVRHYLAEIGHTLKRTPWHYLKPFVDRIMALALLLLITPLFFMITVFVVLDSSGPAFCVQRCYGRKGKTFSVIKFRTMYVNSDAIRMQQEGVNDRATPLFKMRTDPRVTRVGRVLRRYSLDGLPQLFNVLVGHMSIVGPRAMLPQEVEQYGQDAARTLLVKPGVTGLWQVSGRSDLSWEESIRLELRYVEDVSFGLDLAIAWMTVRAIVVGRGAY
ncbi:sugar transferase [Crossiella cryophila]|nr:sugar transferase [Crossiella cryophila]